ncbi:transglutaminase domain-containing protein [Paenibacillus yanchengensis]|uniref:Transglutaminase domain-containing protein n=1 Tax=Paenibacillus yanchengensis TaxID=2035833 RepID=A0ABW4YKR8_9BACL
MKALLNHWYEKITSIIVFLIVLQTIEVFENYWWSETFTVVYVTLSAALAVQLLLPWRWFTTKIVLHWLFAGATIVYLSGMQLLLPLREYSLKQQIYSLIDQLEQIYAYVLIVIALLFIYEFIIYKMFTRKKMTLVFVASMLTLTIADSYTPIWLWDNVAIVVLVFLIYLAMHHLHELHQRHPQRGKQLLQYPIQVLLPLSIVLGLVMIVGVNVPAPAPFLQDPYTWWKQSKGESVHVFLGEKAASVDRKEPVLTATSGYGRDDSQLGGGFMYDYSPVMTVETTQKSYWRGESKSYYSGLGWTDEQMDDQSEFNREIAVFASEEPLLTGDYIEQNGEKQSIVQHVKLLQPDLSPVVFAASSPYQLLNAQSGTYQETSRVATWNPELAELYWDATTSSVIDQYSIVSEQLIMDEAKLREREANISHRAINDLYVQLPTSLPDRVKQLAYEVTEDATNDYERAKLLETYLSTTYPYSNQPDFTKLTGDSTDFVDQFLFEVQEGYCDYYSTAMVVLARSLEMPARWVKGYTAGSRADITPNGAMPPETEDSTGAGVYTVRNADAHSWVEIYFADYGWVPFEPTAGFSYPLIEVENAVSDLPLPEKEEKPAVEEVAPVEENATVTKQFNLSKRVMSYVGVVLLLGVIGVIVWKRNTMMYWIRTYRYKALTNNEKVELEMKWLIRDLRRYHLHVLEEQTIREAIMVWLADNKYEQEHGKQLTVALQTVLYLFEAACYGNEPLSDEQIEQYQVANQQIRHLFTEASQK